MSKRGIVMSIERDRATVMLAGGAFKEVAARGQTLAVGQEIWLPERSRWTWGWLGVPAAAALGLGLFVAGGHPPAPRPMAASAVLSVDINPSINLDISAQGRVLKAQGLDAGGRRILHQELLTGEPVTQAVESIIRTATHDGYLRTRHTVVLGVVFSHKPAVWFHAIAHSVQGTLQAQHVSASVVTVSGVSAALVKNMEKPTVSVGRYLLWHQKPRRQRRQWSLPAVRSAPVTTLLNPSSAASPKPSQSVTHPGGHASSHAHSHSSTHSRGPSATHSTGHAGGGPLPLPNLPVSMPSVVVTPPSLPSLPSPPSRSGRGRSKSPRSGAPPSQPVSNPVSTGSSVANSLGL